MIAQALYHLPGAAACHRLDAGSALELDSLEQLGSAGCQGFVMAPFAASPSHPIVLLPGTPQPFTPAPAAASPAPRAVHGPEAAERERYAKLFGSYHALLERGTCSKIVLARQHTVALSPPVADARQLFAAAVAAYPTQFVALVTAPQCGTWLVATPEVLLQGSGTQFSTMALAGTMTTPGPWDAKNRHEQAVVASYIATTLQGIAADVTQQGPTTVSAAKLHHLQTRFAFTLPRHRLGTLLERLHPTPAVCGMPKATAAAFIGQHEQRGYYSGFLGPVAEHSTHLYVNLRCMRLDSPGSATLFAGSGIMPDSQPDAEWSETQNKLNTMLNLLER